MKIGVRQIALSLAAMVVSLATVVYISQNAGQVGGEPLIVRALILDFAIVVALAAIYPLIPIFTGRPGAYALCVCLPAIIPGFFYYLYLLPAQAGEGLTAQQLQSQLITDSSSNGIIEVGFSYPIYTPTISIRNNGLYTRQVNVFLRMSDGNNEDALFRAVRSNIPDGGLSVEATVGGMLSENSEYIFRCAFLRRAGSDHQ